MKMVFAGSALSTLALIAFAGDAAAEGFGPPSPGFPTMPTANAVDWTRLYAGIHGGLLWGDVYGSSAINGDFGRTPAFGGPLVGVQVGGAFQSGPFVFGVEGDIAAINASTSHGYDPMEGVSVDMNWLATLRGTVGVAHDHLEIYATGGGAWAGVHLKDCDNFISPCGSGYQADASWSGVAFGGGINVFLNQQVSMNLQYLHLILGETDWPFGGLKNISMEADTVRFGFNFNIP